MFENPLLRFLNAFYELLVKLGANLQSLFLLWMRLTWGHQFFLAGSGKLHDISKTIQFFTSLNIPHPELHAYLVGWLEMIGGILLILGLVSRLASLPLIFIMIGALFTAHAEPLAQYKFVLEPSVLVMQAPYPFLITALLVFIFGPGRVSLDAWIKRWAEGQPKF